MQRETWATQGGFVLATIGAAVGLGNVWRFSYVAGENGGAAFLLVYLCFILLLGIPLVIAEIAVGRRGQGDAISGYVAEGTRSAWAAPGILAVAAAVLILAYYSVIAGWVAKYFYGAVAGSVWEAAAADYGGYFALFIADPLEPLLWHGIMMGTAMLVIMGGVRRGIERLNQVLMPLLALIIVALAVYSLTLKGSGAGVAFMLSPDWSALATPQIYLAAMGQAFFSLGLGMAVFATYGSYLARHHRVPVLAGSIVAGDTLIAIVAGLAIFPAVFAFGLDPKAGPELVFITLPQIFLAMPGGKIVGLLFFGLLTAAALTSMISLLEVAVAAAIHRLGLRRRVATASIGIAIFVTGIPAALSFGLLAHLTWDGRKILDSMDYIVSNLMLPVVGILTALYVGWRWARRDALAEAGFSGDRLGRVWLWLVRIVAPLLILVVLVRTLLTL